MNTLSQNADLDKLLEYVACEFQRRFSHPSLQRLGDDSWYCPSCSSIIRESELANA